MRQQLFPDVSVPNRVTTTDGMTTRTTTVGVKIGDVLVTINERKLRHFVESAVSGKSGRKVCGSGLIIARVANIRVKP